MRLDPKNLVLQIVDGVSTDIKAERQLRRHERLGAGDEVVQGINRHQSRKAIETGRDDGWDDSDDKERYQPTSKPKGN